VWLPPTAHPSQKLGVYYDQSSDLRGMLISWKEVREGGRSRECEMEKGSSSCCCRQGGVVVVVVDNYHLTVEITDSKIELTVY
jgi:hypothetical protein